MFRNAQNLIIVGGQFTSVNDALVGHGNRPGIDGMQLLLANVVPSAFHNSQDRVDPPKCHPETRVAIIHEIMNWREDIATVTPIMWLHGPAGAGKSAIAQTVAEKCQTLGVLGACFFFTRMASERSTPKGLIATLSYQLTETIPQVRPLIQKAVEDHPLIFQRTLDAQVETLIIAPLRALRPPLSRRMLLVIDGLDECNGPHSQLSVLQAMVLLLRSLTPSIFLLCASRPEQAIRQAFDDGLVVRLTRRILLSNNLASQEDLRMFFRAEFEELKRTHLLRGHLPTDWPSADAIEWLVKKASGQFSYASTVMKYIKSSGHRPIHRLQIILGVSDVGSDLPFTTLDAVYLHILSCTERIDLVLNILRVLVYSPLHLVATPSFIEEFFIYEPGEVTLALSGLHSILQVPSLDDSDKGSIQILHASMIDFLKDPTRAGAYYLDRSISYAFIVCACIRRMLSIHRPLNEHTLFLAYATFDEHLQRASPTAELLLALNQLDIARTLEECSRVSVSLPSHWHDTIVDMIAWSSRLTAWDGRDSPDKALYFTLRNNYDTWLKSSLDRLPYCDCLMHLLAFTVCKAGPISCLCICEETETKVIELDFLHLKSAPSGEPSRKVLEYFYVFLQDETRAEDYAVTEGLIEEVVYQYVNDHLEEIEVTGSPLRYQQNRRRKFGLPSVTTASRLLAKAPRCRETFLQIEKATLATPYWVSLYLWTIRTFAESYLQGIEPDGGIGSHRVAGPAGGGI